MMEENTNNDYKKILKVFPTFRLGICRCGCKEQIPIRSDKGFLRQFVHHHNSRLQGNPNWGGGFRITQSGYKMNKAPDHPYSTKDGYVMEHRLVYEEHLTELNGIKTYLHPSIEIHHINKQKQDNRIENLQLLTKSEHTKLHHDEIDYYSGRICSRCKSDKTSLAKNKGNKPIWLKMDDKMFCRNCYRKERWKKYGRN